MISSVAVIGDAGAIGCWSGTPYFFGQAARRRGWTAVPWNVHWETLGGARLRWNLSQLLRGRKPGGYQYSRSFLDRVESSIAESQWAGRVLTFHQHFPRSRSVVERGGRPVHYVDATFASACTPGGFGADLPGPVQAEALALERSNYVGSDLVVTMARWAADSVRRDCGVPAAKVATILPGANLELPPDFQFTARPGPVSRERPLVLGFVGKDWRRKGLPFLLEVRRELERLGTPALVRAAGHCPPELSGAAGVNFVGFIDKAREPGRFLSFLTSCDLGCLFSRREPLGISTLEFLRAGVPVAGFAIEGTADTIPPDAGFRFSPDTSAPEVAKSLHAAFADEAAVDRLRQTAQAWSPLVTWERCVGEWQELLATGAIKRPVQPWRGLASQ